MKTQIIILLLLVAAALRLVSSHVNIPPAPILPELDVSSFPDYMQRLLANRPSLIHVNKPNHHEASNENGNILSGHNVNTQNPGGNIGIPRTNSMNPINNQRSSLDQINNVQSKSLFVPQSLRKPHTYGMNLRDDKGEIWNDISGTHLYINDFAPSKSIHPNLLHNKEDEPSITINNNVITPKHNNDYNQKLSVPIKPATLYATSSNLPKNVAEGEDQIEHYKEKLPSIVTTEKPEMVTTLIPEKNKVILEEIPAILVWKNKNINQFDENIPSISNLLRDVLYYVTPQPEEPATAALQDNSAANATENQNSTEIPNEIIVNTSEKDEIVQTFNDISPTVSPNKEYENNQSPKTFGMKLIGDHGYVWNDLTKPGIHYIVGALETTDSTNLATEEEMNPSDTSNITGEPSIDITTSETSHINPTTASNTNEEEKLTKNITPELVGLFKMYIEKLVREKVAKLLDKNNDSENKILMPNVESKTGDNHYGSLIGNGKVTNLFVFYPNNKNIKSDVNENTILSKPVNEILNDMLKGIKSNEPDDSNQQDTNSSEYMRIGKFKDYETTTQSTSEINVATVDNATIDKGNQTTQTSPNLQDDATEAEISESTTVAAIESSEVDITNSTVTERNSNDFSTDPSLEVENKNETIPVKPRSNEDAESTPNAEEPNITIDPINSSIATSNEDVNKSNETEATQNGNQDNDDAELTTISNSAEVGNTATSIDIVTSEGTTAESSEDITAEPSDDIAAEPSDDIAAESSDDITAKPSEDVTTDVTSIIDSITEGQDNSDDITTSSDVSLPNNIS